MDSTEAAEAVNGNGVTRDAEPDLNRSDTQTSKDSQTASEFVSVYQPETFPLYTQTIFAD